MSRLASPTWPVLFLRLLVLSSSPALRSGAFAPLFVGLAHTSASSFAVGSITFSHSKKVSSLVMTWIPKHFEHSLLLVALSVLSLSATSPGLAADLTYQDIEDAVFNGVYDALTSAPLNFTGGQINVVDWLYPSLSTSTLGEWLMYSSGWDTENPASDTLRSLLRELRTTATNTLNVVDGLASDLSSASAALDSLTSSSATLINNSDQLIDLSAGISRAIHGFNPSDGVYHTVTDSTSQDAVRVDAPDTEQALSDINANLGYMLDSLSGLGNIVTSGSNDITNNLNGMLSELVESISSLNSSLGDIVGAVSDLNSTVSEGGGTPDPSGTSVDSLPTQEDEEIESPEAVTISAENLDVELGNNFPESSHSKVILWNQCTIAGHEIPEGSFDLVDPEFSTPVRTMGLISRTIWWLFFYLAVYFLIRREVTYYASLGHTDGG